MYSAHKHSFPDRFTISKVTDFGISKILSKNMSFNFDSIGTLPYYSPEIIKGEAHN
jgi:serine/threonine protein kinase